MTQKTALNTIEFYFDPISPYAWLASARLDEISEVSGASIIAKPVLFAGLLNAHGNLGPAEIPAKRAYIFRDVMRRATTLGLQLEGPPGHPFNPLLSLRICTAIKDDAQRLDTAIALCHSAWADGQDLTDTQSIRRICTVCGLDADWALAAANDTEVKQQLIDNTAAAADLGIFGVPTFRVDDQIFWGEDRIDELLHYIDGQRIDEGKLAAILSRKEAARRRQ